MDLLPQVPQPVDHDVVGVEDRIERCHRDLTHAAAHPDVHLIVNRLQLVGKRLPVALLHQGGDLAGLGQPSGKPRAAEGGLLDHLAAARDAGGEGIQRRLVIGIRDGALGGPVPPRQRDRVVHVPQTVFQLQHVGAMPGQEQLGAQGRALAALMMPAIPIRLAMIAGDVVEAARVPYLLNLAHRLAQPRHVRVASIADPQPVDHGPRHWMVLPSKGSPIQYTYRKKSMLYDYRQLNKKNMVNWFDVHPPWRAARSVRPAIPETVPQQCPAVDDSMDTLTPSMAMARGHLSSSSVLNTSSSSAHTCSQPLDWISASNWPGAQPA